MEFTDSRYLQSLSDKKSALSSFIDEFDKKVSLKPSYQIHQ
jgi:hypothetical protein